MIALHPSSLGFMDTSETAVQLPDTEQAVVDRVRASWLAVGRCALLADRARAEHGVTLAYEAAGLPPPRQTLWMPSPRAGFMAATVLLLADRVPGEPGLRAWLREQAGPDLWDRTLQTAEGGVGRLVCDEVDGRVLAQVGPRVVRRVGRRHWKVLQNALQVPLAELVWDRVGQQVSDAVQHAAWGGRSSETWRAVSGLVVQLAGPHSPELLDRSPLGQHDAAVLALLEGTAEIFDLDCCEPIRGLTEIACSSGWWWPFEHAVVLTERPRVLLLDGEGRLHREGGPALHYEDDLAVWSVHGQAPRPA